MKSPYLRLAKRYRNAKRSYLLVNPLQAKHIPVAPSRAISMMEALGEAVKKKYPEAPLVIGFAETATAIGLAVAGVLGASYLQTTREAPNPEGEWILFQEEHSHAQEQKLCRKLPGKEWGTVILVDDEISTGKTIRNMVEQLRGECPELSQTKFVTASILYRLDEASQKLMEDMGIGSVYLERLPEEDYEGEVSPWQVEEPAPIRYGKKREGELLFSGIPSLNPRLGVKSGTYLEAWGAYAKETANRLSPLLTPGERILVLGTEECMMPALLLGRELEFQGFEVRSHSTTRSPIGVSKKEGYPIFFGQRLHSFYERDRLTYLYDLSPCDTVLLVSDAKSRIPEAMDSLRGILEEKGYGRLICIGGDGDV